MMIGRIMMIFYRVLFSALVLSSPLLMAEQTTRPNLLFIIVDDLNHIPLAPQGRPRGIAPNMDQLAREGVSFSNAHCNVALCESSRTSLLYGLYPQTSGIYWFESWKQRKSMSECIPMTRHLRGAGYRVYGTGKVYHKNDHGDDFISYGVPTNYGPHPVNGIVKYMGHHSSQDSLLNKMDLKSKTWDFLKWEQTFGPLEDIPDWSHLPGGKKGWTLYGKPWYLRDGHNRDLLPDEDSVEYAKNVFKVKHKTPFALFCGFVRTHTPLYAPKSYFDRFPLDQIRVPTVDESDTEDTAKILSQQDHYGFLRFQYLRLNEDVELYKKWIQAYLACQAFVDDQIGALMKALRESGHGDNTVVVFTSDHGFHMGEKGFLYKHSLWEESTRIPLVISGTVGNIKKGASCDHPVSLVDLYPTVVDVLGLPPVENPASRPLDGHSLKALLQEPKSENWDGPEVAITALSGIDHMMDGVFEGSPYPHFAVRSKHFRYILCSNGEEELYDHRRDPLEHRNLANSPEVAQVKAKLRRQLVELRDGQGWEKAPDQSQQGKVLLPTQGTGEVEFDMSTDGSSVSLWIGQRKLGALPPLNTESSQPFRARFDGKRIEVWLNGLLCLDINDGPLSVEPIYLKASSAKGRIQASQLRYRNF